MLSASVFFYIPDCTDRCCVIRVILKQEVNEMAIYMVDYENVYIEGLNGLDQLTEEDTLHIFYTQNRCGLTFALYEQLIRCRAKVELNEVAVSPRNGDPVKNALDLQLMMFAGYLIGTCRNTDLFIVSKDKDFALGTNFFEHFLSDAEVTLQIVPSIAASMIQPEPEAAPAAETALLYPSADLDEIVDAYLRDTLYDAPQKEEQSSGFAMFCDRYAKDPDAQAPAFIAGAAEPYGVQQAAAVPAVPETDPMIAVQYHNTVRNLLGKGTDEETITTVCDMISSSESLVAFNNALTRYYRDGKKAGAVYHKFKPKFENLRHLSRAARKG